jgi:hypothetical protein
MIRSLNFTNRKKIDRSCVRVKLLASSGEVPTFDAEINLGGLGLPPQAEVYMEAYYKSSYMRFPYGQVDGIVPPTDRRLTDIQSRSVVFFRLKVVDPSTKHGRILAVIDRISPRQSENEPMEKDCILPVDYRDLGEQIFKLEFEDVGGSPVLVVNERLGDTPISHIVKSDDQFFCLVYPQVVREIMNNIFFGENSDEYDPDDDSETWQSKWMRYMMSLGVGQPPHGESVEDGDKQAWIDDAVDAFCKKRHVRKRYEQIERE